jgi:hypothetical protein
MSMFTGKLEQSYLERLQKIKSLSHLEMGSIFFRGRSSAANDYDSKVVKYIDGKDRDEGFEVDNKTFVDQMRD